MTAKPTLKEIASLAGVSVATVDRVLNSRGAVHSRTVQQVEKALEYASDPLLVKLLKYEKIVICLIAHNSPSLFLDELVEAFVAAARESILELEVKVFRVAIDDPEALKQTILTQMDTANALAIMPIDHPKVIDALQTVVSSGKPVVSLQSAAPGMSGLPSVGQNNRAAGRAAGLMMANFLKKDTGKVGVITGKTWFPSHEDRERGFRTIMSQLRPEIELIATKESNEQDEKMYEVATHLFASPDLIGIYNIGGCNEVLLARAKELGLADITIVAHDLNATTRSGLIDGVFTAIIHQDPVAGAKLALQTLIEAFDDENARGQPQYSKIEIVTQENIF